MNIIHLFAFLLIFSPIVSVAPAGAVEPTERQKLLGAESFTLSNGMQVVLIPNTRAPVITQMVWYKVGAADEEAGKTGLAHFLEHLMFKGSKNVPPGELSKRVRALGGNDNAFTAQDYTSYYQSIAVQHMETVMKMEADRMKSLLLPPEEFESERQVVLEERRERTENDPRAHLYEQMRYALFPGHPYATPVIGWEQDIKTLTRADALEWHKTWYTPGNAVLIVSGDITAKSLKPVAEKIYGSLPVRPTPETILPPVNLFPAETRMTLRDPRIHQPQFIRLYRVPGVRQNKQDSLALEVLQEILSSNASTRLYKSLVFEQKLATSASLSYQGQVRGTGTLSVSITPAEDVTLEEVEAAYEAEIAKLVKDGIKSSELSEAKTRLKDGAAYARDSLSGPARIIGAALAIGATLDDVEYWTYDIDAVTAEQIKNVAQKYLLGDESTKPAFVTGYVLVPETKP
ncbi:MAG: M16 family metallopeptidase [Micavibrio sp.]